jgi:aconitate decarboxylase
MNNLTSQLATYVADARAASFPERALEIAKLGLMDSVATMFAGADQPAVAIMLEHLGARERSNNTAPVPFAGIGLSSQHAAMVNGVAAHVLDYDDVALSAHPSTVLMPAILAEGHGLSSSGEDVLRAYVVGYEVWAQLAARDSDPLHVKGWHPTGVFGAVAAAAAVAYLNGLPSSVGSHALGLAASMSSGLVANFGSMAKAMHAGRAASCGIEAVHLAMLGFTASPDVFEHPAGFLKAFSPAGRVDVDSPVEIAPADPAILRTGLSIKQYPICYSSHRVVDAVLDIVSDLDLRGDDIEQVDVAIGLPQAAMLRNHAPVTGLEAKFSLEFAVAASIVSRAVGLDQLEDSFVARDDVQALFPKVRIRVVDTVCPLDRAFALTDRVVIQRTGGGACDSGEIRFPRGHAMNPISAAGLQKKFHQCLGRARGVSPATDERFRHRLYDRLLALDMLANIRTLYQLDA